MREYPYSVPFDSIVGVTMSSVTQTSSDRMLLEATDGRQWDMIHEQDCCESCSIEDIVGDLGDLVGSPIVMADESTNHDNPKGEYEESFTWTFYKLATAKGYVTIRWYGSSNGYYGETATFRRLA
jgi:hypothetical protein